MHIIIPVRPAVNLSISHFTLVCHGTRSRQESKMRSGLIISYAVVTSFYEWTLTQMQLLTVIFFFHY